MGSGNLLCQIIMYHMTKQFDPLLFITYALFGFFVSGPFVKVWWDALEYKIFKNPKQFLRPIKMMLLDQSTSPFILNGCFLYVLAIYGGKSHSEAVDDALNRCIPVCLESYKVWPMVMILNFYVIPPNNRFENLIFRNTFFFNCL